jgi:hypothetical protein
MIEIKSCMLGKEKCAREIEYRRYYQRPFASGMTFNLKFALIPLPTLGDHGSEKDSARRGTRVQNGGLFSIVPKYFSLVYKLLLST